MTPLTTPMFNFHLVGSALATPTTTPTPSLMKASHKTTWKEGYPERIILFFPWFRDKPWARIGGAFVIKIHPGSNSEQSIELHTHFLSLQQIKPFV